MSDSNSSMTPKEQYEPTERTTMRCSFMPASTTQDLPACSVPPIGQTAPASPGHCSLTGEWDMCATMAQHLPMVTNTP